MTNPSRPPLSVRAWRYYQRHGVGPLLRRIRDELRPVNFARPQKSSLPSSGLAELQPELIYSNLDTPSDGAIESSSFLMVLGWACSRTGIAKVEAYIDGRPAGTVRHGQSRPDVADYLPRIPGSGASGFSGELNVSELHHGSHRLEVVIDDVAGNRRILEAIVQRVEDAALYEAWLLTDQPSEAELADLQRVLANSGSVSEIVVWVDARNPDGLAASVRSIDEQTYGRWQCVILAPPEGQAAIEQLLEQHAPTNRGRFDIRSPEAVSQPGGAPESYAGFLASGETLAPWALSRFAARTMSGFPDLLYSDRDALRAGGGRVDPWFNPDWSPDYLLARDYVGGFYLLRDEKRAALVDSVDRMVDPAWRYDLLLRLTDDMAAAKIAHIPHVLYSIRHDPDAILAGTDAELAAAGAALTRRRAAAEVKPDALPGTRRVRWQSGDNRKVSIIVPTTGRMDFIEPLVTSLTTKTAYANYELIFIDNSRGRNPDGIAYLRSHGFTVLERDEDFNWAKLNNHGARAASGELLLFLNDDIEIVDADWLTELVGQALRPDVGAVGGLLLYPDGRIQHGGVFVVGYGGGAVHYFQGMDPANAIYRDLHRAQREVSAVTGACLMIERSKFEAVGGFNERLEIAGNDVDLCLRLLREGYRNIWTPYCMLVHHESATRLDTNIVGDETKIWQLWGDLLRLGDPYHSPNFAKDRVDLAIDARKVRLPAPGRSHHPAGVNLIGYIRAEMGVGEATRGTAAALSAAQLPFAIVDYQYGNPSRMNDKTWDSRVATEAIYDVNVVYVNADLTPEAFPRMPSGTFDDRYTIGCWTWELPEFPDEWLGAFAYVDEVWAPSTFVQHAIAAKSPVPVLRMAHAIPVPKRGNIGRPDLGLPTDAYLFLAMYDKYSVRQRKNPEGAIEAFARAFPADDVNVGLVIKVNNADDEERKLIRDAIGDRRNVHVIDRTLARPEVSSLLAEVDCFVSLHRSEGFGLAIAEAMALGQPVVATNWSGNVDFMDHRNAACIDYELVQLDHDYGPYRAGQRWAEPDLDHAVWWMRELFGDAAKGLEMGRRARDTIERDFSAQSVGRQIKERLSYIRSDGRRPSTRLRPA